MFIRLVTAIVAVIFSFSASAQDLSSGRWVDLTHAFNENSVFWPTAEKFKKSKVFYGQTKAGFFYAAYNYSAAEHGGTHMDAPIHFAKGAKTTDQVPVDQLIGPGVVIDISVQSAKNVNYRVTATDIEAFEARNGKIPKGAIVLFNTGRAGLYSDLKAYMGTAERGQEAVAKLRFPGLGIDGTELLIARGVSAVGIDTPSIDYGQSQKFATHVALLTKNIPVFENVGDMSKLPPTGSTIIALPMKIEGGSGGALRIVAHLSGN